MFVIDVGGFVSMVEFLFSKGKNIFGRSKILSFNFFAWFGY